MRDRCPIGRLIDPGPQAKRGAAVVIAFGACSPGCGNGTAGNAVVKMTATYVDSVVHVDPHVTEVPLTLAVRNEGNVDLRIESIDGGCRCRKVDKALSLRL